MYPLEFVGLNKGIITNCRSELKIRANKGHLAGFVSENTGTITSSYYKNALITNLGEDELTSTTAGFVNINKGNIKFSYIEGEQNNIEDGVYLSNSLLSNYCITAPTSVGGFVFNNEGNIEDCYSNLSITSQSFSGGFVYTNSGTIKQCYSASKKENENTKAIIGTIGKVLSVDVTLASNSVQFLGVIIVLNCGREGSLLPGGTGGNDQAGIWMSGADSQWCHRKSTGV